MPRRSMGPDAKRNRYCKNGHDTEKVGRYADRGCKVCSDKRAEAKKHQKMKPVYKVGEEPRDISGIRRFREDLGFTTEEVAQEMRIREEDVRAYESGERLATPQVAVDVWHALQALDAERTMAWETRLYGAEYLMRQGVA